MIKSALLLFWMVSTQILTFTIVGMLLFIPDHLYYSNPEPTTWMLMGLDLTEKLDNKIENTILFLFWILFTIILTCSIFGLLLFIPSGNRSSTWMKIGKKLITSI